MGVFRKQPKQGQQSDWIQPAEMMSEFGPLSSPELGVAPMPARLRQLDADGRGDWLRGAVRMAPGSLQWIPESGVQADPVELATATVRPGTTGRGRGMPAMVTELQTPAGRFQLEYDPQLFEMTQELVAEEAATSDGP